MAVEIPVVIDIEGAFKRAAEQARSTMKPLQQAIDNMPLEVKIHVTKEDADDEELQKLNNWYRRLEKLQDEIGGKPVNFTPGIEDSIFAIQKLSKELDELNTLRQAVGGSDPKLAAELAKEYNTLVNAARQIKVHLHAQTIAEQKLAAVRQTSVSEYVHGLTRSNFELQQMREYYLALEQAAMQSADSINAIRSRISDLNAQWNNFSKAQREGAEGREVYAKYKIETKELREQAKTLEETLRLEQRKINISDKVSQKRKYETSVLNTQVKTIRILQEQQRILTERLNRAPINSAKYRSLQASLEKVRAEMDRLGVSATKTNSALHQQSGALSKLASAVGAYVSIWSALRLVKQLREVTGELEYQRVALGHIIQDEEYGARLFEKIKAQAVESPFRVKELVTYTKQLSAYQVEQEDLFDTMKRLADVSAGLGVDMNRLILAYGQVRAASVLRGQELRQFTEAGIPLVDLLAKKMGELNNKTYTTAEVFDLISKRAVPFSAISSIFEDLTEKGGIFYEMQEEQAKTLIGRWEKMKDVYDLALASIGETKTFQRQNDIVLGLLRFLAKHLAAIPKLIEGVTAAWVSYSVVAKVIALFNKKVAASNVAVMTSEQMKSAKISQSAVKMLGAERVTRLYSKAQTQLAATSNIAARAMGRLTMAMLTNPYLAIGAAIAGIVISLVTFNKKQKETNASLKELDDSIEHLSEAAKRFNRNDRLISTYERLASKTERSSEENDRLANTIARLSDAFPSLTKQLYNQNAALDDNIEKLKEKNKQEKQAAINEARKDLNIAKGKLNEIDNKLTEARITLGSAKTDLESLQLKYNGRAAKMAPKRYDEMTKAVDDSQAIVDKLERDRTATAKRIRSLERYLMEDVYGEFGSTWRNIIKKMQNVEVDGETLNIIDDEDIRGYKSLYDALKKIDKKYKDSTESLKGMKAALQDVDEQYKAQAEKEIKEEEARARGYKAVLDEFGYDSSKSQKNAVKELREELRIVQDIHTRYEKLRKIMGDIAAGKEIKKIYGSVTKIDFLNPEDYKQRLQKIMSEIRHISNKVKPIKVDLALADSMTDFITKNEGFLRKATNIEGKGLTLGYGFFKKLPDGRTITEEMELTEEEGKKLFQKALPQYISKAQRALDSYGSGLQLTKRQFTVLVDLAYQSGSGVQRILKEAQGDATKIAELLKSATWKEFAGTKLETGLKTRDLLRSKIFESEIPKMIQDAAAAVDPTEIDVSELMSLETDAEKIVQDVDWNELEKKIKAELKSLSDKVKKSAQARDFYNDILSQTGDEQVAATLTVSVYGDIGKEFKERVQDEMFGALNSVAALIDPDLFTRLTGSITIFDMEDIKKNVDKLPDVIKPIFEKLLAEQDKYEGEQVKKLLKSIEPIKTYGEKRIRLASDVARQIENIQSRNISQSTKDQMISKLRDYEAKEVSKLQYEAFKDSKMYISIFENLDATSYNMLKNMREQLIRVKGEWKNLNPTEIKELQNRIRELDKQMAQRNPFKALADSVKKYNELKKQGRMREEDEEDAIEKQEILNTEQKHLEVMIQLYEEAKAKGDADEETLANLKNQVQLQKQATDAAKEAADAAQENADEWGKATNDIVAAVGAIKSFGSEIKETASSTKDLLALFVDEKTSKQIDAITENIVEAAKGIDEMAKGAEQLALGNYGVGTIQLIVGLVKLVATIANAAQRLRDIEMEDTLSEQERTVNRLEAAYKRLDNAIQDAFGSEYIALYNQQLELLYAEADAINEKIEATKENLKYTKKDSRKKELQDQLLDYQSDLDELDKRIADMQKDFQNFFTGTDITSAAREFAKAWIDAYKSFGNTTAAMKEKFREMIENMVTSSLAAEIVKVALQDVFNEIDAARARGGIYELDIANVAGLTAKAVDDIDKGLGALMQSLAHYGINMRGTASGLSGIAKDFSGITEQTALGIAAGINTQNYYMSFVPTISQNVALIANLLGGGGAVTNPGVTLPQTANTFGDDIFRGQMNRIDENIAILVDLFRSVRSVKSSSTNTHVIAVNG